MTRRAFAFIGSLLLAAPIAAASVVLAGVDRFLHAIAALFTPVAPRLATSGPTLERAIGGRAVDAATLHSLRHEAGVPRVSAARNT